MKKVMFMLTIVVSVSSTLNAVDMTGKFGMGLQFLTSPLVNSAVMRYGIAPLITLEPSFGIYNFKSTYEETYIDPETGNPVVSKSTSTYRLTLLFLLSNFTIRGNAKSNLIGKFGFLWGKSSYSETVGAMTYTPYKGPTFYGILLGFGLEHFFNDHFAANVAVLTGYIHASVSQEIQGYGQPQYTYKNTYSLFPFGNQLLDFSLMWYY